MREKLDQSVSESRDNATFCSGVNLSSTPADKSFQPFVSVDGVDGPGGGDIQPSSQKSTKVKGALRMHGFWEDDTLFVNLNFFCKRRMNFFVNGVFDTIRRNSWTAESGTTFEGSNQSNCFQL